MKAVFFKLIVISSCLFLGINTAKATHLCLKREISDSSVNIILVRLVESVSPSSVDSEIVVVYGKDSFERIELKNISGFKGYPTSNLEKIHLVVSRLYTLNYELISTYESGLGANFIFKRKED